MSHETYDYVDDFTRALIEKVKDPSFDGGDFTCGESHALVEFLREWSRTSGNRDALQMGADVIEASHEAEDKDPGDEHYAGEAAMEEVHAW